MKTNPTKLKSTDFLANIPSILGSQFHGTVGLMSKQGIGAKLHIAKQNSIHIYLMSIFLKTLAYKQKCWFLKGSVFLECMEMLSFEVKILAPCQVGWGTRPPGNGIWFVGYHVMNLWFMCMSVLCIFFKKKNSLVCVQLWIWLLPSVPRTSILTSNCCDHFLL